jgi:sec-independent protein translocase protein TatB
MNLGAAEVLVILVLALVVLGPEKLPSAARQAAKALGEVRRFSSGFQTELRDAMREPVAEAPRAPRGDDPIGSGPTSTAAGDR